MNATQCLIHAYVHQGRIGVLVELAAQTDFATRSIEFQEFAQCIALHIAASSPESIAALLAQPYVKDDALTVGELLEQLAASLREHVAIVRFARWTAGESLLESQPPEPPRAPAVTRRA